MAANVFERAKHNGPKWCFKTSTGKKQTKNRKYHLVENPVGWLTGNINQDIHECLHKIDPNMEGLQDPILGPINQFKQVTDQFVQILHTGNDHWVCVSSVGVNDGVVNLYDSLYRNVIRSEVEKQLINLVGENNYVGIHVVPVQQQTNGSDCGVFSAAFATCLLNGIQPQKVQFDIPKMRPHLLKCLEMGQMKLFPVF